MIHTSRTEADIQKFCLLIKARTCCESPLSNRDKNSVAMLRTTVCSKSESQISERTDDRSCTRLCHPFVLVRLVGVADAVDACQAGTFNVGDGVAH